MVCWTFGSLSGLWILIGDGVIYATAQTAGDPMPSRSSLQKPHPCIPVASHQRPTERHFQAWHRHEGLHLQKSDTRRRVALPSQTHVCQRCVTSSFQILVTMDTISKTRTSDTHRQPVSLTGSVVFRARSVGRASRCQFVTVGVDGFRVIFFFAEALDSQPYPAIVFLM